MWKFEKGSNHVIKHIIGQSGNNLSNHSIGQSRNMRCTIVSGNLPINSVIG
jgi:hypothetical protein